METVTLTIDGRQVTVEKGKTVLQAAIESGISVPYYCYHPGIGIDGSCRVCIVKIEKMPKLQTSCSTVCTDGMVVQHADRRRRRGAGRRVRVPARSTIRSTARSATRAASVRCRISRTRSGPTRAGWNSRGACSTARACKGDVDFGPTLMLNRQRCILCTRCVRFMRDVDGDAQINIIDRGYGSEIATFQEEGVHSLISGNLMDVCPVGAITTRDYRFKSRPWDNPNAADTICTLCSKGCNTTAWIKAKPEWAKGSRLIRFTPRFNPDVNGYWMCDIGRFDYHWIEGDDRLRRPLDARRAAACSSRSSWHDVTAKLADRLAAAGRAESGGRPVPPLGARVARRALPVPPPHRGAGRRPARQSITVSWRYTPKPQPEDTKFRCRLSTRRTSTARGSSGWRPAQSATARATRTLGPADGGRSGRVSALYVFDPGPDGSIGDTSWIVDARANRHAAAADRPGRAADRPGARRRFRAAGRILRREGSVLHQRPGTAAGNGARDPAARRGMEDWQILVNLGAALGVPFDYTSAAHDPRRHRGAIAARRRARRA